MSPGLSPSASVALNFPLSRNEKQPPGFFFSSDISLLDLKGLGHIGEVLEDEDSPRSHDVSRLKGWVSKSAKFREHTVSAFHEGLKETAAKVKSEIPLEPLPPPPGFPGVDPRSLSSKKPADWCDYSSGANYTPSGGLQFNWEIIPERSPESTNSQQPTVAATIPAVALSTVPLPPPEEIKEAFQLKLPPKKVKRVQRGTFSTEIVMEKRVKGTLKFYNLKKRFGFVTVDDDASDVFLCEDDIVLSEVNYKKFKEDVVSGLKPRFEFSIKLYQENSHDKKKAINIRSLPP